VLSKKQHQIITLNKAFTITIKPFEITQEILDLYQIYFNAINFEASPSLESYLGFDAFGFPIINNVFESYGVEIRNSNELIAYGVFDNGKNSIAGIINFYNPAYKKYSLGKYLMLVKLQYAKTTNKAFYYPGYIAKGWTKFDYKLFIGKHLAEIWHEEKEVWISYNTIESIIL
jgi:leucyl-tRNA---protein transferase